MPDLIINKTNVTKLIESNINKQKANWIFLLEIPEEKYFEVTIETIKILTKKIYSGLYVSFLRPYQNLVSVLKVNGIATDKISFIDAASSQAEVQGKETEKCAYISKELDIDELTSTIYTMLPKIKGKDRFLFIDSITTLTLYQPLSEALRFAEFLSRTLRKEKIKGVVINVAKDVTQKKFIKDVMLHVNKVVRIEGKK